MTDYELEVLLDDSNFSPDNLIRGKQSVLINSDNGLKSIKVDGFQLSGYNVFDIREFMTGHWILSIAGRMLTYGSYDHVCDIIKLLIVTFDCWDSKTSLVYFLQCEEYSGVIKKILNLRDTDHRLNEAN